jgi:single-strand DNA-binding protein
MPNHQTITIVGHAGKDADLRTTQSGEKVAGFSVAVKNRKDETTWYECAAWGKTAENYVGPYLKKGSVVFLVGEPSLNIFTKRDGTVGASIRINVRGIQIFNGSDNDQKLKEASRSGSRSTDYEDDIPF